MAVPIYKMCSAEFRDAFLFILFKRNRIAFSGARVSIPSAFLSACLLLSSRLQSSGEKIWIEVKVGCWVKRPRWIFFFFRPQKAASGTSHVWERIFWDPTTPRLAPLRGRPVTLLGTSVLASLSLPLAAAVPQDWRWIVYRYFHCLEWCSVSVCVGESER